MNATEVIQMMMNVKSMYAGNDDEMSKDIIIACDKYVLAAIKSFTINTGDAVVKPNQ